MENFNLMDFCWEVVEVVIDSSKKIYEFLFTEISILDNSFKVIYLLTGGAFIILITAWLVKKVVPVA